jgi:hypothetical protein
MYSHQNLNDAYVCFKGNKICMSVCVCVCVCVCMYIYIYIDFGMSLEIS